MNANLTLSKQESIRGVASLLPASKSIANRVLILNALSGNASELNNLSDANDTRLMMRWINSSDHIIDVEDAGTTMRFLTAYYSVTGKQKHITGTQRMKERPIGLLVDALRALGVDIAYTGKEGFPPLEIKGFASQLQDSIRIRGDVSSQFISALMMVAPVLPNGLTITLEGKIGSRPYIEMTASLMKEFGAHCAFTGNQIRIEKQDYKPTTYTVESDWSAASYWFAFVALAREAEIQLPRISLDSLQGDREVERFMKQLGVRAVAHENTLTLTKTEHQEEITCDFTHCPDLAQTLSVVCAAKGITGRFTGMESLRIKETDRIAALQQELKKIGATLVENDSARWTLIPSENLPATARFLTYKDHRMAMAFAPLATRMEVEIENPAVVKKSYPNFWKDLEGVGFPIAY